MKNSSFNGPTLVLPLVLLAIWAAPAFVVNPIGDFPLNDDFSFSRSVFNLTERGIWEFDDWLSMTLISQVLWGGAFCKVFGFSFSVLRISTLVSAYFGLLAMYATCRELGQTKLVSFTAALVLAFNPLFFSLSYTFMTDVPFASMCLVSSLFYIKYFKEEKWRWLAFGSLFAIAATFTRQLGLMLPLSFAVAYLWKRKPGFRTLATALLPATITLLLLQIYMEWFNATQGTPDTFGTFSKLFKRVGDAGFTVVCFDRVGMLLIYMGWFLLPLNLLLFRKPNRRVFLLSSIATVVGLLAMFQIWERFPWGNIFYNLGLGPKTLKDGIYFINVFPVLPQWAARVLSAIGIASAILLIFNLVSLLKPKCEPSAHKPSIHVFAIANLILYGGFLMLDVHFFDRYFIPLLPFLLILLLPRPKLRPPTLSFKTGAFAALFFIAVFSVTATHDYLSWNRARWRALGHLTKEKNITPNEINGGFEFNGWHRPVKERTYGAFKSWWWVDKENYLVTFGKMDGFKVMETYPYSRFLPPGKDSIFILEKAIK